MAFGRTLVVDARPAEPRPGGHLVFTLTDPARVVVDDSKLDQIVPELDNIRESMGAMGGPGGQPSAASERAIPRPMPRLPSFLTMSWRSVTRAKMRSC